MLLRCPILQAPFDSILKMHSCASNAGKWHLQSSSTHAAKNDKLLIPGNRKECLSVSLFRWMNRLEQYQRFQAPKVGGHSKQHKMYNSVTWAQ